MAAALVSTLYFRFMARGAIPDPSPLLESLLARADQLGRVTDWRADVFRVFAPCHAAIVDPVVAAPVAMFAAHGAIKGAWVCMATPVRYTADMSSVRLPREGILRLDAPAAAALAGDFNRVWRDSGVSMQVGRFADLFCTFDAPMSVVTHDPEIVLDRYIEDFLPHGTDAHRLRRLMSEMEMWLFEHAATRAPAMRPGQIPNGLWLWGGGTPLRSVPAPDLHAAGEDALFNYYSGDVSQGGVVIAPRPGSEAWRDALAQWLAPALAGLKSGRLTRLLLSADDRCFAVSSRSQRRFWRRRRLWTEHFD